MEADFLILADAAQVQGEKLSMLGGGWTVIRARQFPAPHSMAVAAGILVDWLETNTRHHFVLEIRDEDAGTSLWKAEGDFEQGRPAGMPGGTPQRLMMAFGMVLTFRAATQLVAELSVDGANLRQVPFRVIQAPQT